MCLPEISMRMWLLNFNTVCLVTLFLYLAFKLQFRFIFHLIKFKTLLFSDFFIFAHHLTFFLGFLLLFFYILALTFFVILHIFSFCNLRPIFFLILRLLSIFAALPTVFYSNLLVSIVIFTPLKIFILLLKLLLSILALIFSLHFLPLAALLVFFSLVLLVSIVIFTPLRIFILLLRLLLSILILIFSLQSQHLLFFDLSGKYLFKKNFKTFLVRLMNVNYITLLPIFSFILQLMKVFATL